MALVTLRRVDVANFGDVCIGLGQSAQGFKVRIAVQVWSIFSNRIGVCFTRRKLIATLILHVRLRGLKSHPQLGSEKYWSGPMDHHGNFSFIELKDASVIGGYILSIWDHLLFHGEDILLLTILIYILSLLKICNLLLEVVIWHWRIIIV